MRTHNVGLYRSRDMRLAKGGHIYNVIIKCVFVRLVFGLIHFTPVSAR